MRILLIQLKRIGDVILTTPVLSCLREAMPSSRVVLAVDSCAAALVRGIEVDEALVRGVRFWSRIAAGGFDVALDFTGNDRSALVAALSRAGRRITYQRFAKKPLRRLVFGEFVESSVRNRHTADHHTDLLHPLKIVRENVPASLRIPAEAAREADAALAEVAGAFAVIHAGSLRPEKYWRSKRWAQIAAHLNQAHHLPVVFTGSKDETEQAHLRDIQCHLPVPCTNLAGRMSLLGTAAVIQRARVLCSVDSAPVHLADAVGTPVVALFGPTNPFHWQPRGPAAAVVTPHGSGPFTPDHPKGAMDEIEVHAVESAIARVLPSTAT